MILSLNYTIIILAKDNHKKGTILGGYIEAYLIIRSPLLGPEVIVTEERSLVLDTWPDIVTTSSSSSSSSSSLLTSSLSTSVAASMISSSSSIPSPSSSSSIQLTKEEMTDPHSVSHIESNEVLEFEIAQTEELIGSYTSTKTLNHNDDNEYDDNEGELIALRIRLQLLQSKLQVLVYKVQNEVLCIEDYLKIIRERIKRDQTLALYLKQSTTKDSSSSSSSSSNVHEAIRVLKRVKIMQKEVSDTEENMRNG